MEIVLTLTLTAFLTARPTLTAHPDCTRPYRWRLSLTLTLTAFLTARPTLTAHPDCTSLQCNCLKTFGVQLALDTGGDCPDPDPDCTS